VELHFKTLTLALVPQPRQMPVPPFDRDELQRIFAEVGRHHSYQSFEFIYNGRGAQFQNGEDDLVELRPALLRVQAKMDGPDLLTASMAEAKAVQIVKIASERLQIEAFLQCVVHVIASVGAPDGDAQKFVGDHLLKDADQAAELGPDYFGGGVRFRRLRPEEGGEDNLSIEPDVNDNSLVYLSHQIARAAITGPLTLDQASTWVGEGLNFVEGPSMQLLSK
jgi:hypothetical protein